MNTTDIFKLLNTLNDLKHLKRTGWVKFNLCNEHLKINKPETVASHMYRMAMFAMVLDDKTCDQIKCIKMALVHDLGEAIIGDITPHCGVSSTEKHRLEKDAMEQISKMVPLSVGSDWYSLWQEYEERQTKEAIIVKHLDEFDMVAQAFHYEQKYEMEEFFEATRNSFTLEPFVSWIEELRKKRCLLKNSVQH
ncbi:unnamed protein product [Thelazia callipaeda]|uniref:5'-deoxynucleotidase HDDC2 n=1 Tax=Thelazia callipaeda TaxID=103827 RepID=A0A0N5D395_THECL|nr:unnamed protein product [Thelazia callipaeda]